MISCLFCNSKNINKSIMAPNLQHRSKDNIINNPSLKKNREIDRKIQNFQNFIKKNFENVGNDFTYRARSLHYNTKKGIKGIYGNASKKQIKELQEEGIETQVFPWIDDKKN